MKRGWYKNSYTGDVVFLCGSNDSQVFYRVRSGETTYERKPDFYLKYKPIKASGFPPVKPKEFKPRYAVCDRWSEGEAYVEEFEPGKFKVVMKDGREVLRDRATCRYFTKFFKDGSWKVVPEAEAKARLDKPKAQFNPLARYRGLNVEYHPTLGGDTFWVTKPDGNPLATKESVCTSVVRNLWELGKVVAVSPRPAFDITKTYESVHGGYYLVPNPHGDAFNSYRSKDDENIGTWTIDVAKKEYELGGLRVRSKPPEKPTLAETIQNRFDSFFVGEKPKKKVLVEWAILLKATPNDGYYTRLVPEGRSPATSQKKFKTGRTVEVPE